MTQLRKFHVTIQETVTWTDEIECHTDSPAYIEKIVRDKWINSEYSEDDSTSSLGQVSVVQITEIK
jgi:hypothetical protein